MLAEDFEKSLRALQRQTPFQPITVELVSGSRLEIDHPEALVHRGGKAVFIRADGELSIFDHEGVNRIVDSVGERSSA